jgi:nucleoid DNA-binding protein
MHDRSLRRLAANKTGVRGGRIQMTKAELIARVYSRKSLPRDLTKKTVSQIVDFVFTEMGDYFIQAKATRTAGAKLTYPGFGTFSKRLRPGRVVRLPGNGPTLAIPPQFTVTFLPGAELKALLNRPKRVKAASSK